ncbi:High-affinity heme uptake system protein IsdE precursor [Paenibacillus konkukensis]|uniref:High-affinity heme uptake system protein IsdE n=1 Tax=Paenibacillus konkukensis TaxID=2020716 RepID=A0ABY4RTG9_9BACL|nr:ABC transporter substrate-binding protein [Paenibacillus konkukensis]UQZ85024.1 High-affinity heme uptake system protein IsdE precursor [Paenibacillus konkukensis]
MRKSFILAAILLGLSGCGNQVPGDSANAAVNNTGNSITIKDFADRTVSFPAVPTKIAALANGETDIIQALGGDLVGRPTSTDSSVGKELQNVEQVGSTHGIDLEKIAYLGPDVVLGNNPMNMKDVPAIEGIGSKMVLTSANSIDEIKKQIVLFGQLLHKDDKAKELIGQIDTKVQQLQTAQNQTKPRVLLVYGAPGTYMAALNNSLSGDILVTAGGENIAADYPKLENYPQYAQLNSEKIIQSNPQLVLIMSHGNSEKVKEGFMKEMQQNAAWNSLDAVKNNRVEVLPADLFGTSPGTRIIEALDYLAKLLQAVKG